MYLYRILFGKVERVSMTDKNLISLKCLIYTDSFHNNYMILKN